MAFNNVLHVLPQQAQRQENASGRTLEWGWHLSAQQLSTLSTAPVREWELFFLYWMYLSIQRLVCMKDVWILTPDGGRMINYLKKTVVQLSFTASAQLIYHRNIGFCFRSFWTAMLGHDPSWSLTCHTFLLGHRSRQGDQAGCRELLCVFFCWGVKGALAVRLFMKWYHNQSNLWF